MPESPGYYAFLGATGILWVATYVLIIKVSFRDRSYGMPLVALCGNISWEFQYAFVHPYDALQRWACVAWFLFNLVIMATALRFGPSHFPVLPARRAFYPSFAAVLALAYLGIHLLARYLEHGAGVYTGFAQTFLMSGLFLSMLLSRRSLRGQSLAIAYTKMAGTLCASLAYYAFSAQYRGSLLLAYLCTAILLADVAYVAAVHSLRRKEAKGIDLVSHSPLPQQAPQAR
ncbi:transmembrane-type terpene cyclase [Streptomyces chrestomyceticus]|uniref:transmembrane-type terpene cyclase n=1 Tax=Streptomyces chrestomyceticus TaxID=68185 RepID=UPI0037AE2031